jgi:diacylglycerol kinase (ATP)
MPPPGVELGPIRLDAAPSRRPERLALIVNPRAGSGRCRRQAAKLEARLGAAGIEVETEHTSNRFEGTLLARAAYARGHRHFLAAGGDGTAFEVLNGVLPPALDDGAAISFGVLALGTGNSWARSFQGLGQPGGSLQGVEQTMRTLEEGTPRRLDVLRVHSDRGEFFALSFVAFGLACTVADLCNRRLKWLGNFGYELGAALCALGAKATPTDVLLRRDGEVEAWRGSVMTFGAHNTSLFGGALPISPTADPADGLLDCVLVEAVSRATLLRALPSLRTGTHLAHPAVHTTRARSLQFQTPVERDVLLDGEVRRLAVSAVEVLPAVAEFWI